MHEHIQMGFKNKNLPFNFIFKILYIYYLEEAPPI